MKRRLLSILLIVALAFTMAAPMSVLAAEKSAAVIHDSGSMTNPLYPDLPEVSSAVVAQVREAAESMPAPDPKTYTYVSPLEAAKQLRDACVRCESSVELHINLSGQGVSSLSSWVRDTLWPWCYDYHIAEGVYDGDYLQWRWTTVSWSTSWDGTYADICPYYHEL